MATISADQLPTPTFAPPSPVGVDPRPAMTPAGPARSPKRAAAVGTVAAAIALAGGIGFFLTRGGGADAETSPISTTTTVDGGGVTQQPATTVVDVTTADADLSTAYSAILGAQPSADTISCLSASVDTSSPDLQEFLAGITLDLGRAQATFAPFIGCAPDADFLVDMETVSQQLLGSTGDPACIEQTLVALDTTTRTEAIALAHADPQTFVDQLFSTVAPCA